MSKACRVAVRIIRRGDKFIVKGRKTSVTCDTLQEAWEISVEYFTGKRW